MISVAQLLPILPAGYADKCSELCEIKRWRGIKTPEDLMQLSLFHLLNGCTLIEISQIAKSAHIAEISDVAFMDRFAACGEWFKAICAELAPGLLSDYEKPSYLRNYRAIAFDASDVAEKGRSSRIYRLHYGIDIFTLNTASHKITDNKTGEKMNNFTLTKGDLAIADRAYGTINGIDYCLQNEADFIFRLRTNFFCIYSETGEKINLMPELLKLDHEQTCEISAFVRKDGRTIPIRICARKKDKAACGKSREKVRRRASRKQEKLFENTEIFNEYIVLATSLPSEILSNEVLEAYRYRWQIENYFKRLKSIMDFGELPKKREKSSLAWLNGKLMVALLIELLIARFVFSPVE
jgi:hypothetical protein